MFEEAMPRLRQLSATGAPFFAVFLTASDHVPYVIPEGIAFTPRSAKPEDRIVEYADWSIGHFMELALHESWFANTLFVFVADHGSIGDTRFEISLDYHHSPFILYSADIAHAPRAVDGLGEQVDIGPTILGRLRIPYVNNTVGTDLFREQRHFVFFSDDDVIGCLDGTWFLVRHQDGRESLFRYAEAGAMDHHAEQSAHADSMSRYARSMFQAAQWMVRHRLVGGPEDGKKGGRGAVE
jgi:phosphoglycerol transferase MdoB-like AlkP superfamily enzyme